MPAKVFIEATEHALRTIAYRNLFHDDTLAPSYVNQTFARALLELGSHLDALRALEHAKGRP
jgi:hypothetical protein